MRNLSGIDEFLDGVRTACLFFGGPVRDIEIYQEILIQRGWDPYLGISREELQKNGLVHRSVLCLGNPLEIYVKRI